MLFPIQISGFLGVAGTAVLILVVWLIVLGFLIVHFQHRLPLEVFRLFQLRANPVMTLLVLVPFIASFWGGVAGLHALRTPPGGAGSPPERDTIATAFDNWVTAGDELGCGFEATDEGPLVRPMVLVAASGGGIRAAAWAGGMLDVLSDAVPEPEDCVSRSVFLSSGVSGGSVGLVVAGHSEPGQAFDELVDLAAPDSLAAAVTGLLVGDLVGGSSGLRIPSVDEDWTWDWRDRAGLMETVWERDAGGLAEPYDATVREPAGVLVLNSTTATGCRMLVSQVQLDPEEDGPGSRDSFCAGSRDDLPASLDLQQVYGECLPDMTWATAAMLSARFPTVTPAGRAVADDRELSQAEKQVCERLPELQLIDGGYAESSGVGTLADIAPAVLREVREHNATRSEGEPVVVPIVLYLEDEPRTEIVRDPAKLTPELVVPLEGQQAKGVQVSTPAWLQRVAAAYARPCTDEPDSEDQPYAEEPDDDGDGEETACTAAVEALRSTLTDGVVVAAPFTKPAVEAPLGWTLSPQSLTRLEADLADQLTDCPKGDAAYGCTRNLLDLLREKLPANGE